MLHMRRMYAVTCFVLISFTCPAVADIYTPGEDAKASFAETIENDELLSTPMINETAKRVKKFNDEKAVGEARLLNGLSSMKETLFYARRNLDPDIDLELALLNSIESVWFQLSGREEANELIRPTNWKIDQNDFTVSLIPGSLKLNFMQTYLSAHSAMSEKYRAAIDSLGILVLTQRTLDYIERKNAVGKIGLVAKKRKEQWNVYFENSIPQWPWELAFVNVPIYQRSLKNELGLGEVPQWQLIVLHPDIALEYIDSAEDGDRLKPALLVELIGADFWSWKTGAKQRGPWGLPFPLGASIIATLSDRADSEDWGFGGVLHVNHVYNFGASFNGDDTSFFVSFNIGKLFENTSKKAKTYLEMVGL